MNNKTEDRFYFGKPEQKTKFGSDTRAVNRQARMWLSQANNAGADEGLEQFHARLIKRLAEIIQSTDELIRNPKKEEDYGGWSYDDLEKELLSVAPHSNVARRWLQSNLRGGRFSRPGSPERFGLEDACWEGYEPVGTKQKDGRTVPNCVPKDKNEHPEEFADDTKYPNMGSETRARMRVWINSAFKTAAERNNAERKMEKVYEDDPAYWSRMGWKAVAEYAEVFSRPGQPDKFDASSLDRGNFAEASKSPMLGKLLAEKAMPDGGWRAVQVGSDTLVISFEDADLARDFGRRAASKGYSATSPVATTGRYWNVEVKNG